MCIIFSAAVCCHAFVLEEGTFDLNSETVKQKIIAPAEKGDANAQIRLATIHKAYGNHDEAMKWLIKAAEQGNITAMRMIAMIYYEGDGVTQDKAEGLRWFRKAADKGDKTSKEILRNAEK